MPIPLKRYLLTVLYLTFVMGLARFGFALYFSQATFDTTLLGTAMVLGGRFDLRLAALLASPALIAACLPIIGAQVHRASKLWLCYWSIMLGVLVFIYIVDAGHYSYLSTRLNANALFLLRNTQEAAQMVWQSYPILWIAALWLTLCFGLLVTFAWLIRTNQTVPMAISGTTKRSWKSRVIWILIGITAIILPIHGRFSQYPLRWSDLHFTVQTFYVSVATNPVFHFYETFKFAKTNFDQSAFEKALPLLRAHLDIQPQAAQPLDMPLARIVPVSPRALPAPPNLVVIYLESFAGYKTSAFGNPLNPTPFFKQLSDEGAVFTRFYSAHAGTARGVFAGLTGIPDVELSDTASRNPLYAQQYLLPNTLSDYEKYYFIGGSTSWANMRGTLRNIEGLRIYEDTNLKSPLNDVWGVSDKNMMLEANQILGQAQTPFFAMLQTAGNHRPFTIPSDERSFQVDAISEAKAQEHGFLSSKEYNAVRLLDFSLAQFFQAAKQMPYFDNTIFILLGDHGISGKTGAHMAQAKALTDLDLAQVHTPFLVYAPKFVKPQKYDRIVQQVDVMPTLMGFLNRPYRNQTLGVDVFAQSPSRMAFKIKHEAGPLLDVFDDRYMLRYNLQTKLTTLHDMTADEPITNVAAQDPARVMRMQAFATSYYLGAQYLLRNNRPAPKASK
jgi:phosphoglycerol transferase MdoB-like AlkP superfamily enzyme